jgi:hypothetical protein
MSKRACIVLGLAWVLSLVVVAAVTAGQAKAYQPLPEPKVMTGDDVGFRVEGMYGPEPAGTIVVRVNGQWVEASLAPGSVTKSISAR